MKELFTGNQYPEIQQVHVDGLNAGLNLVVGPDICWFDGHFDQVAVLPGVVQVHWAGLFLCHLFKLEQHFSGADNIKFQHVIQPPAHVLLELSYDANRSRGQFCYRSGEQVHSKGSLLLT